MERVRRGSAALRIRTRKTVVLAVGVVLVLTAVAAAGPLSSLGVAKRTVKGRSVQIVVDGRGVTVYELGGESLAKLKCVTRKCFNVWPPAKVSSASAKLRKGKGVPGKLSIMQRVRGGFYQAMLDRHPLYYYSKDKGSPGSVKGQGINSFGGGWHVVKGS
jgi:predicted lipoprotein with Yx(FWY)xxD motif